MTTNLLGASGPLTALLAVLLVLAVWFDVRQRRIPNWLTVGGAVGALVIRTFIGFDAVRSGLAGGAVGLSLGLLLFAVGAMGAGDGKLLAAVGACLGLTAFVLALPLIAIAGGVLALVATTVNGTLFATLLRFRDLVIHLLSVGRLGERRTLAMPGAVTIPYGVAVAAGAAWGWLVWGVSL